jgi:ferritin-like metal-binding protein YciE
MTDSTRTTHKVISDWTGDIVALVGHVEEALDHQLKLKSDNPTLTATIQRFHDSVRADKQRAEAYQQEYGSTAGNPVIKKGAELLGKAAGLIDQARRDSVAKALRDDFTAFNHVAMAYTMLHATAMAYNDTATEAFAGEGLKTWARMVQEINQVISEAVVDDLANNAEDPAPNTGIADSCRAFINEAWASQSA